MVKCAFVIFFVSVIFASGETFAQAYTAPLDSMEFVRELYDPSLLSNEVFLRTPDDLFGDELQFISDDIARIASYPIRGTAYGSLVF